MSTLKINLDDPLGEPYIRCDSLKEWQENRLSRHWHYYVRNRDCYQMIASNEPLRFPAIGIMCGMHYDANGPDVQHICWFYEFELED